MWGNFFLGQGDGFGLGMGVVLGEGWRECCVHRKTKNTKKKKKKKKKQKKKKREIPFRKPVKPGFAVTRRLALITAFIRVYLFDVPPT